MTDPKPGHSTLPISFHLRNPEDTMQLGVVLGDALRNVHAHPGAVLVLLSGELGAGKTSFSRGLAAGLGADADAVSSPTFTIRMDHAGETRPFVHIDAWRLSPEELEQVGFEEILAGDAVVAIEWPERIASALPSTHVRIALEHADAAEDGAEPGRTAHISLHGCPERAARRLTESLELLVRAPRLREQRCPTCGRPLEARAHDAEGGRRLEESGGEAPFCSRRCRLADLSDWLAMRHRIAGAENPEFDE